MTEQDAWQSGAVQPAEEAGFQNDERALVGHDGSDIEGQNFEHHDFANAAGHMATEHAEGEDSIETGESSHQGEIEHETTPVLSGEQISERLQAGESVENLLKLVSDVNDIVAHLSPDDIADNMELLRSAGAELDAQKLMTELNPWDIAKNAKQLLELGIDSDELLQRASVRQGQYGVTHSPELNIEMVPMLMEAGIDTDKVMALVDPVAIIYGETTLKEVGVVTDFNQLAERLKEEGGIEYAYAKLIDNGVDVDMDYVVSLMKPVDIAKELDKLLAYGASIDVNELIKQLSGYDISTNLDRFLRVSDKLDIAILLEHMRQADIGNNIHELIAAGATVEKVLSLISDYDIARNLNLLIAEGATINVDDLVARLNLVVLARYADVLKNAGANIDMEELITRLSEEKYPVYPMRSLVRAGADSKRIISLMNPETVVYKLQELRADGAQIDINSVVERLGPERMSGLMDELLHAEGLDVKKLVSLMRPADLLLYFDKLNAAGAQIDSIELARHARVKDVLTYGGAIRRSGGEAARILNERVDEYFRTQRLPKIGPNGRER